MKNTRIFRSLSKVALSASFLLALASVSKADLTYFVSLDVSSLLGNSNAPFALDFQLVTGSGNVTNTVTLSNFMAYGGNLALTPDFPPIGGATGSAGSGQQITLTNSSADNEYGVRFDAGVSLITFKVTESLNSEINGAGLAINDQFNVAIYDTNGDNLRTSDLSGGNALLSSVIASGQTLSSVQTFTSPDSGVTTTAGTSAIPEPGSAGLLLVGVAGLLARRKRSAQPAVA